MNLKALKEYRFFLKIFGFKVILAVMKQQIIRKRRHPEIKEYPLAFDGFYLKMNDHHQQMDDITVEDLANGDDFYPAGDIGEIPDRPGIYGVYVCSYKQAMYMVSIKRLIYIGRADNLRCRIENHEIYDEWKKKYQTNVPICFNFVEITDPGCIEVIEPAMIYEHQPEFNEKFKDNIPFDFPVRIRTSGQDEKMKEFFTVQI